MLSPAQSTQLAKIATNIRINIVKMLNLAGSGHAAGSLGLADILTCLYFHLLNHDPKQPRWPARDYVLLSHGHVCPAWYATLAEAGYFDYRELASLRKNNSKLQGHPHFAMSAPNQLAKDILPGIENSSGPLGQGISQAVGLAIALQMDHLPNQVYCLMSDGEQQEGQVWEAYLLAAKYRLSNLMTFIDRNYIQIDGHTEKTLALDPLDEKLRSFGWLVYTIDGHNFEQIVETITSAKRSAQQNRQPVALICQTKPGKGVDFMEQEKAKWHGLTPNQEQTQQAVQELTQQLTELNKL